MQAEPGGAGSVLVSWDPSTGAVDGYIILYGPADTLPLSMRVTDSTATTHTIEGIAVETEYTVQMLAYIDLPSSLSNSATVYLDGERIRHTSVL